MYSYLHVLMIVWPLVACQIRGKVLQAPACNDIDGTFATNFDGSWTPTNQHLYFKAQGSNIAAQMTGYLALKYAWDTSIGPVQSLRVQYARQGNPYSEAMVLGTPIAIFGTANTYWVAYQMPNTVFGVAAQNCDADLRLEVATTINAGLVSIKQVTAQTTMPSMNGVPNVAPIPSPVVFPTFPPQRAPTMRPTWGPDPEEANAAGQSDGNGKLIQNLVTISSIFCGSSIILFVGVKVYQSYKSRVGTDDVEQNSSGVRSSYDGRRDEKGRDSDRRYPAPKIFDSLKRSWKASFRGFRQGLDSERWGRRRGRNYRDSGDDSRWRGDRDRDPGRDRGERCRHCQDCGRHVDYPQEGFRARPLPPPGLGWGRSLGRTFKRGWKTFQTWRSQDFDDDDDEYDNRYDDVERSSPYYQKRAPAWPRGMDSPTPSKKKHHQHHHYMDRYDAYSEKPKRDYGYDSDRDGRNRNGRDRREQRDQRGDHGRQKKGHDRSRSPSTDPRGRNITSFTNQVYGNNPYPFK